MPVSSAPAAAEGGPARPVGGPAPMPPIAENRGKKKKKKKNGRGDADRGAGACRTEFFILRVGTRPPAADVTRQPPKRGTAPPPPRATDDDQETRCSRPSSKKTGACCRQGGSASGPRTETARCRAGQTSRGPSRPENRTFTAGRPARKTHHADQARGPSCTEKAGTHQRFVRVGPALACAHRFRRQPRGPARAGARFGIAATSRPSQREGGGPARRHRRFVARSRGPREPSGICAANAAHAGGRTRSRPKCDRPAPNETAPGGTGAVAQEGRDSNATTGCDTGRRHTVDDSHEKQPTRAGQGGRA